MAFDFLKTYRVDPNYLAEQQKKAIKSGAGNFANQSIYSQPIRRSSQNAVADITQNNVMNRFVERANASDWSKKIGVAGMPGASMITPKVGYDATSGAASAKIGSRNVDMSSPSFMDDTNEESVADQTPIEELIARWKAGERLSASEVTKVKMALGMGNKYDSSSLKFTPIDHTTYFGGLQ